MGPVSAGWANIWLKVNLEFFISELTMHTWSRSYRSWGKVQGKAEPASGPAAASCEQIEWANISSNLWEPWNGCCIISVQQISHKNHAFVWSSSEIHRKGNPGKCGSAYLSGHIEEVTTDVYYYDSVMTSSRLESRLAKDKITCKITQMIHVTLSENVARPPKGLGSGVSRHRPISSAPLTFSSIRWSAYRF